MMDDARAVPAPRTSLWAIASLVLVAAPCPPLCVIGPLLGVVGLVQIRRRPEVTGARFAILGIILGLMITAGWGAGLVWWQVNVRTPMIAGPHAPLSLGLGGDVAGFRRAFTGDAALAPETEAAAFLSEVRRRYGAIMAIRQELPAADADADAPAVEVGSPALPIPYRFSFEHGEVLGAALFVIADDDGLVTRWGWIRLTDPDLGDLVYPVSAADQSGESTPPVERGS